MTFRRARRLGRGLMFVIGLVGAGATPTMAEADDYFALIVSGATGGAAYVERYDEWRQTLVEALRGQEGFRDDHLTVLAETPGPGVGRASREGVGQAFRDLRHRMSTDSVLLIVLLGHGTDDGIDAKFNLVGPDLDAGEWGAQMDQLPGRVVFVNTTSASYPFVRRLSGSKRVVIAATQSSVQRYDTIFPEFFVRALAKEEADADRDGRVSVWEAFVSSSAEVRLWFQRQGRLATERAVLDDTGDGRGKEADEDGPDGALAARVFVGAGVAPPPAASDPSLVPLIAERENLEDLIAQLKSQKSDVEARVYDRELERLLVDLARVSRDIRRLTGC